MDISESERTASSSVVDDQESLTTSSSAKEGADLTIWRSRTRNTLEVEDYETNESTFLALARLFVSVFTILSFVVATSPRAITADGRPLNETVNITLMSHILERSQEDSLAYYIAYSEPIPISKQNHETATTTAAVNSTSTTLPALDPQSPASSNYTDTYKSESTSVSHIIAQLYSAIEYFIGGKLEDMLPKSFKKSEDTRPPAFNNSKIKISHVAPVSILAIPALFGQIMEKQVITAPLAVLDIDACSPFEIDLPEVRYYNGDVSLGNSDHILEKRNYLENKRRSVHTNLKYEDPATIEEIIEYDDTDDYIVDDGYEILQNWYAFVPRGHCPFDVKVYYAKLAGFAGCIIYNNSTTPGVSDLPVRMSPNSLASQVLDTQAMFLTNKDALKILNLSSTNTSSKPAMTTQRENVPRSSTVASKFIYTPTQTLQLPQNKPTPSIFKRQILSPHIKSAFIINLRHDSWPSFGNWGNTTMSYTLLGFLADVLFLSMIVIVCGGVCTGLCLILSMLRNYLVHGRLFIVLMGPTGGWTPVEMQELQNRTSSTQDGIDLFELFWGVGHTNSNTSRSGEEDTLEKIVLPIHVIEKEDLIEDDATLAVSTFEASSSKRRRSTAAGGTRLCCAICIDEFSVGSRVRELPCHHQFHDSCIDPWLLRHNRLCPICKRDVLAIPKRDTNEKSPLLRTPTVIMEEGLTSDQNVVVNSRAERESGGVWNYAFWG